MVTEFTTNISFNNHGKFNVYCSQCRKTRDLPMFQLDTQFFDNLFWCKSHASIMILTILRDYYIATHSTQDDCPSMNTYYALCKHIISSLCFICILNGRLTVFRLNKCFSLIFSVNINFSYHTNSHFACITDAKSTDNS